MEEPPPEPVDLLASERFLRETMDEQIDGCRIRYANTGNPIYVWSAIKLLAFLMSEEQRKIHGMQLPPPVGLPEWCMKYLEKCAKSIETMTFSADPRLPAEERGVGIDDDLTERQMIEILPSVLGFSRKGWNAFSEYRRLRGIKFDVRVYEEMREEGVPVREAMEAMFERMGVNNERSVRRIFAEWYQSFEDPLDKGSPEKDET